MRLPTPDPAPRKRSETRDLVQPMIRSLNRLPGVRVARNANLGPVVPWAQRWLENARPIVAGLGTGSADIVGIVACRYWRAHGIGNWLPHEVGRAFALEVKLPAAPGLKAGSVAPDQVRWLRVFRRFGGFAAVVHSLEEARAAVDRCQAGHAQ